MATREYCADCARTTGGNCFKHQSPVMLGYADPLPPMPPDLAAQVLAIEIPRLQEAALDRERLQGENAELRQEINRLKATVLGLRKRNKRLRQMLAAD